MPDHVDGQPGGVAPVLIVGSGPAGLFAACELVRHGVTPRIVEKREAPHRETRGTALQPAVLEILDRAGLVERFLEAGTRIRHVHLRGPGLADIAVADFSDAGSHFDFQCSLPQWRTEAILRDHLASRGVAIEHGIEVTSIEESGPGLAVTLSTPRGTETATHAYVLGAGGARSVTRHSMQQGLEGETYGGQYFVADVGLTLPCPPESGQVIVGPTGFGLFSPLPEGRWLVFVNRDAGDDAATLPDASGLGRLIRERIGADAGVSDLRWISTFKMHKRRAERLADGRRFLMGDAAHLSSPLGGEGINAAFMDAANIAWKLALVVRGHGAPSLLDSYAEERGIADAHVLDVSDEVHGTVMGLVAMCRDGGMPSLPPGDPAEAKAGARRRLMLDVSYAGSAGVGEAGCGPAPPGPGDRFPACHHLGGTTHHLLVAGSASSLDRLRDKWAGHVAVVDAADGRFDLDELSLRGGGAILVRPDGFVGFRIGSPTDAVLAALDAHLSRYLVPFAADGRPAIREARLEPQA